MPQSIALFALVVRDYDEAIQFYTQKLGFTLVEDTPQSPVKRWVVVSPPGCSSNSGGCNVLLAKAANEQQLASVGNQTGGRVGFFLHTDNFQRDFQALLDHQVEIVRQPSKEAYGTVAVFADLYGNLWDLIGP
ncbi:hypothetical protein BGZ73_001694 [Actinomortierella ambigua]|nr:hypothetical protein BGZ73_001694 [Actinomortierella ambigua]